VSSPHAFPQTEGFVPPVNRFLVHKEAKLARSQCWKPEQN
jgi:hypothetical protein